MRKPFRFMVGDDQFRVLRALLIVTLVILGFIAGHLLAFAWQYL